jgi:hypothetical protein
LLASLLALPQIQIAQFDANAFLQAVVSTPGRRGLRDPQDSCLKFGVVTDAVCSDADRLDPTAGSDPEVPPGRSGNYLQCARRKPDRRLQSPRCALHPARFRGRPGNRNRRPLLLRWRVRILRNEPELVACRALHKRFEYQLKPGTSALAAHPVERLRPDDSEILLADVNPAVPIRTPRRRPARYAQRVIHCGLSRSIVHGQVPGRVWNGYSGELEQSATTVALRQIGNFGVLLKVECEVSPQLASEPPVRHSRGRRSD